MTVGIGIDVDPVCAFLQHAGDRQPIVRLWRDDAVDREDVVDVLFLGLPLGVEREGAGLVLLHLEAGVPVADVPVSHAVEPERAVAAAEIPVERADCERFDRFQEERGTAGEPAAAEVVLELGDLRERRLGGDPREIHPWRAVPGLERGLAVGPPLADRAEVAAVQGRLHVDILELPSGHIGRHGHRAERDIVVEIDGQRLGPLVVGQSDPGGGRAGADGVVGIVAVCGVGGVGRGLARAGGHTPLEDA